jgi:hypothetical protein
MERLMRMLKGLTACVALVGAFALTTLTTYANTSVSIKLAVDNGFSLFATDPNTNQLVLIGNGYNFNQIFTFNFTTVPYSYIYLMARDDGVAALFTAKTVFDNGAETVITGVSSSTWVDWEVNTIYKDPDAYSILPSAVLNWGGDWHAPAVGNLANSIAGQFPVYGNFTDGERFIWAPPGGGTTIGFGGYTGAGTALFRLRVLPEPASMLALGAGLAGLVALRRRRK